MSTRDAFDLILSYEAARPSAAELDLLRRVHGYMVAQGLVLPRAFRLDEIEWYRTSDDTLPWGLTLGGTHVSIRAGLPLRELVRIAIHELIHVSDSRYPSSVLAVPEREIRAYANDRVWADRAVRALRVPEESPRRRATVPAAAGTCFVNHRGMTASWR